MPTFTPSILRAVDAFDHANSLLRGFHALLDRHTPIDGLVRDDVDSLLAFLLDRHNEAMAILQACHRENVVEA